MKHLVIGASGMIGWHLYNQLKDAGEDVIGTYYEHQTDEDYIYLDLQNIDEDLREFDVVYVPAGWTDVNGCEIDQRKSFEINVRGISSLVNNLPPKATLVYFSTGYVFGDEIPSGRMWTEYDLPDPINVYGYHKLQAEHFIMSYLDDYLIVRTMFVYGYDPQEKNFVYQTYKFLSENMTYIASPHQWGNPTYVPELVRELLFLVNSKASGILHLGGPTNITKRDWALLVAKCFELDKNLIPDYDLLVPMTANAQRPLYAGVESVHYDLEVTPKAGLEDMKQWMTDIKT